MQDLDLIHQAQRDELDRLKLNHFGPTSSPDKQRLPSQVYDHVVENIRSGALSPGARLTVRDLAKELDISYVPVREAMEKLEQHGWITRRQNKGLYVREFNNEEIKDIYHIREMIEAETIRFITEKLTKKQLKEIKEILDLIEEAHASQNADVFRDADTQFHRLLVHYTANDRLERMFDSILLQAGCFFYLSLRILYTPDGLSKLDQHHHSKIYNALKARDAELAEKLIREHIRIGCQMITELRQWLKV